MVDAPRRFFELGESSLQFDRAGRPHIAYGSGSLYYASPVGEAWRVETVDAWHDAGWYPSLAFDRDDRPHISYSDGNRLRYAHLEAGRWVSETVAVDATAGLPTSLALDGEGNPHIAYSEIGEGKLKYVHWTGTAWAASVVDCSYGYYSLALGLDGQPIIAYGNDSGLMLARWQADRGWMREVVDPEGRAAHPSLRLDGRGMPYIAYSGSPTYPTGLRLAERTSWGAAWRITTIDAEPRTGKDVALAVSPAGDVTIGYFTIQNPRLALQRRSGGVWSTITVDGSNFDGRIGSVALDRSGNPSVVYHANVNCTYKYLTFAALRDGTWHIQHVDEEGLLSVSNDLKLDRSEQPHIAYCGFESTMVWYASRGATGWERIGFDTGKPQCAGVSLAFDAMNQPQIAAANEGGSYATWDGIKWRTEDITNQVVLGVSLVVDSANVPRLGYSTWNDVYYAERKDAGWVAEKVEANRYVHGLKLALDAQAEPRMAYVRNPGGEGLDELVYARRDAGTWELATVVDGHLSSPAFVVDTTGKPHLAYNSYQEGVRYASQIGGAWDFQTVELVYGPVASMALDSAGQPHLTYEGTENTELYPQVRYAYRQGGEWAIQNLTGRGHFGAGPLALDAANNAYTTYTTTEDNARSQLWFMRTANAFVPQPPQPCDAPGARRGPNGLCSTPWDHWFYLPLLGNR